LQKSGFGRGVDNLDVRADRIRKSIGAENTFTSDLSEFEAMVLELQRLIDEIWRHCEDKGTRGRTVALKAKFADFELITRSRTIPKPIENRGELETVTVDLLKILFPVEKAVRLLGVSVSGLVGDERFGYPGQIALELEYGCSTKLKEHPPDVE
jgi:DNA polymerase-4